MYTIEKLENNKFKVILSIDKKDWENYINQAYEENKGKYAVQGFRKGKAPRKVIEQNYGPNIFYDTALDIAIYKEYTKVLDEHKEIEPIDNPEIKIEKIGEKGLAFTLTVQCMPEVKLGAYTGIEIQGAKGEVDDAQIDAEIEQQRNKLARFSVVEREARNGDFVTIDFVGKVDGVAFDGGSAEDFRLELGSHSFIAGFEEQVEGMNIGEKRTINVKFPEDYFSAELKGKDAEFDITLNKVEAKELPELNDEFASDISEFETLAQLREDIKKHLQESLELRIKRENENNLISEIVKNAEVTVPECMTEREIDAWIRDFEQKLMYQGLNMKEFLNNTNQTIEDIRKLRREDCEGIVKTRLVIEQVIIQENLKVTEEELDKKLAEIAEKYKKSLEDYKKNLGEKELIYFENSILMEKFIEFITAKNTIKA